MTTKFAQVQDGESPLQKSDVRPSFRKRWFTSIVSPTGGEEVEGKTQMEFVGNFVRGNCSPSPQLFLSEDAWMLNCPPSFIFVLPSLQSPGGSSGGPGRGRLGVMISKCIMQGGPKREADLAKKLIVSNLAVRWFGYWDGGGMLKTP